MKKMKFNTRKFLSRKFIVTLLTDILGVALLLSDLGGKLGAIMGIVAIVLTSIIYIISEATIAALAIHPITRTTPNNTMNAISMYSKNLSMLNPLVDIEKSLLLSFI